MIRELLINAFAHKSYTISGDIFIKVFPNRLEITNPGGLPLGITKDNILQAVSRRNPHLIRIFHDLKLMEGEGSGFDLIYEIAGRDAKPPPMVFSDFNATTITQYSGIIDEESLLIMDFVAKNYPLSQKEFIALGIVVRHKKILSTQLTKELQLPDHERLYLYLDKLVKQSVLITRGAKKGTEYLVNPGLIKSAKINIKPTLKTIEPYRLKALIVEDLAIYSDSKSSQIQKRLVDLPIGEIRKALLSLEKEKTIVSRGAKKGKTYRLAKRIK